MSKSLLYDHVATGLSALDMEMIRSIPPGGNWTNIPNHVPSRRIDQIREMARERGGVVRTTYYGRLHPQKPSYTISTYFNRPGNGCNIHPRQDRTLSIREAARLQSFPDSVRFAGSQSARRKQVGNAIPVLLARALGGLFKPSRVVDLFSGAGGLSLGLALAGHKVVAATDSDKYALDVHKSIHPQCEHILGDIDDKQIRKKLRMHADHVDLVVGGPPCQGWSYGGWHARGDSRNRLVWSFIQLVNALRPRWFVMENVQGLMWMAKGRALEEIKNSMSRHYQVRHFVLNAADFGVPQRRHRVFIVGSLEGSPPEPPHPKFAADGMFLPKHIGVDDAIGDLPPLSVGGGGDVVRWAPSDDNVPYRLWVRGKIAFDEMCQRAVQQNEKAPSVTTKPKTMLRRKRRE